MLEKIQLTYYQEEKKIKLGKDYVGSRLFPGLGYYPFAFV